MNRKTKLYLQKTGILLTVYLLLRFLLPMILPFFLAFLTVRLLSGVQKRVPVRLTLLASCYLILLILTTASGILCGCWLLYEPCRELLPACQNFWQGLSSCLSWIPSALSDQVLEKMPAFLSILFGIFLYLISVLLFARDWKQSLAFLRKLPFSRSVSRAGKRVAEATKSWLHAQLKIMLVISLECAVGYWLLQIPQFWLRAVLTGFLDALPVFGAGTVFLPWILISLLREGAGAALGPALLYLVAWLTRQLLEPRLLGSGLGLLPIGFLVSVILGLRLFGALGLLLGPFGALFVRELWAELEKSDPPESSWASSFRDE